MAGADENSDASNMRQRTSSGREAAPAQTTVVDTAAAVVEFIVNYEQVRTCGVKMATLRYHLNNHKTKHVCIVLEHLTLQDCACLPVSRSSSVSAIFEVSLMDKDGKPVVIAANRRRCGTGSTSGTRLVDEHVKDGQIRFLCTIRVSRDGSSSIPAPPSDIVKHLGELLDTEDGTDVSFAVGGETFHAHRALLAARAMLRFMYTDALPGDDGELGGDSPREMFERLLAAADRYALDRLKLLCAQKLWEDVSVDTVADTLACAEMYSCPELKHKCNGFFAVENFKKAVLTEGFVRLVQQFPAIIFELRDGAGT
ncbi:hypothetical protein PVAP13_6KG231900 [Panicum virgatum]|uniref:BTB domain-containing protein n=1 Tax=Panicum virgatum TaxID=38727 RepID=A0A8T0RGN5_PANVG|nr:hypothetical protein PVAP13_6KG231900 [Panicum virgatum]